MRCIKKLNSELIKKNRPRCFKRYTVLFEIGDRFGSIPFEFNHMYIVWIATENAI